MTRPGNRRADSVILTEHLSLRSVHRPCIFRTAQKQGTLIVGVFNEAERMRNARHGGEKAMNFIVVQWRNRRGAVVLVISGMLLLSVRYFWLSWAGTDREVSRIVWLFSV